MTVTIKKLLVGATVAASMSAIASAPAFATNLTKPTNIQFTTNGVNNTDANKPNINTWTYGSAESDKTGIGGVNRQVLNDYKNYGNTSKAIAALTDNDSTTNVELFNNGENVSDHVGFTANFGKNTIKVESVTKADWTDGTLAKQWLTGFSNAYGGLMEKTTTPGSNLLKDFNSNFNFIADNLSKSGLKRGDDPNIGDISYDKQSSNLKIDLVGHLDLAGKYVDNRQTIMQNGKPVKNPNYLKQSPEYDTYKTGNPMFDAMLFRLSQTAVATNTMLQMSEIAKVTFNGEVNYAFTFAANESGAIAGDRNKLTDTTSHTGIYSWNKTVRKKVPEPSALFGLVAVGGLVVASRRKRMQNA